jgi:Crp-like helix-turn-helix domain
VVQRQCLRPVPSSTCLGLRAVRRRGMAWNTVQNERPIRRAARKKVACLSGGCFVPNSRKRADDLDWVELAVADTSIGNCSRTSPRPIPSPRAVGHIRGAGSKTNCHGYLQIILLPDDSRPPVIAKVSQETLADMVGTTRSRVSHFMNKFRQLGYIDYNGDLEVHSSLLDAVLHEKPQIKMPG